jgi:hypothetical protein
VHFDAVGSIAADWFLAIINLSTAIWFIIALKPIHLMMQMRSAINDKIAEHKAGHWDQEAVEHLTTKQLTYRVYEKLTPDQRMWLYEKNDLKADGVALSTLLTAKWSAQECHAAGFTGVDFERAGVPPVKWIINKGTITKIPIEFAPRARAWSVANLRELSEQQFSWLSEEHFFTKMQVEASTLQAAGRSLLECFRAGYVPCDLAESYQLGEWLAARDEWPSFSDCVAAHVDVGVLVSLCESVEAESAEAGQFGFAWQIGADKTIVPCTQRITGTRARGYQLVSNLVCTGLPTDTCVYLAWSLLGVTESTTCMNYSGKGINTATAIKLVAGLPPRLEVLDLSDNSIGDSGVEALSKVLPQSFALTELNLSNNNIGDPGVEALSKGLPEGLARFDLSANGKIGEQGYAVLAAVVLPRHLTLWSFKFDNASKSECLETKLGYTMTTHAAKENAALIACAHFVATVACGWSAVLLRGRDATLLFVSFALLFLWSCLILVRDAITYVISNAVDRVFSSIMNNIIDSVFSR